MNMTPSPVSPVYPRESIAEGNHLFRGDRDGGRPCALARLHAMLYIGLKSF